MLHFEIVLSIKKYYLFILSLIITFSVIGQSAGEKEYGIHIRKATGDIVIDGVLEELDWTKSEVATNFYQKYPSDTSFANTKTEVRLTYDDKYLYIGAVCYDELPGDYVITSLKRDYDYSLNDVFGVVIDPFYDKTNGYGFAVNPFGVQMEGLISGGGGQFGFHSDWDDKWFAEVTNYADRWIVEIAIPFKTLRYKEGVQKWRINFSRNDLKRNEHSTWAPIPYNFIVTSLAYTGELLWDAPLKKAGSNISLIPYTIGGSYNDYDSNTEDTDISGGLDAKVAVTSSLNLDLTINPDFSQVEVDAQQSNLTLYDLFYPEKRTFFLENNDLFGDFGFRQIRPFFSRRIGLHDTERIPIIGGARLTGKLNKDWRIGLMSIQTERVGELDVNSQNYTVAAIQRRVFDRSNIAAIFVNKQGFNEYDLIHNEYSRIAGMDFNFASKNDKWTGKVFYHTSITPENFAANYAHASWLLYSSKNLFAMWNHEYVGRDYRAGVGFVPRNKIYDVVNDKIVQQTYWRLEPFIKYMFYPKSKVINKHGPALYVDNYMNNDFITTEELIMPHYIINFQNTSSLEIHYHEIYTKLPYDTDVTFTDAPNIPAGGYSYRNGMIKYESDLRKKLYYSLLAVNGSYYLGAKFSYRGELSLKMQPWGIFSVSLNRDEINLPKGYSDETLTLLGSKLEFSFTKSVFFTTFIQYNTQTSKINVNSRFQYRFKPMSDIYIVYTDNYLFPDEELSYLRIKDRALVIKVIYWFNI